MFLSLIPFALLLVAAISWYSISVELKEYQIILLISTLFALVHYPSLPLIVFTFFMELVLSGAYFKWRNLWLIGLYHGWIASLLLFFVLGRGLWNELWIIF